jgi:hypothetical protein
MVVPLVFLRTKGEEGHWSPGGMIWSLAAGAVSALGVLGAILAFKYHGDPIYVMPLVFGCAPVVTTFMTMLMARSFRHASMVFYLGILIVAVGAAGVLIFKPSLAKEAEGVSVVELEDGSVVISRTGDGGKATYEFDSKSEIKSDPVAHLYYHAYNLTHRKKAGGAGNLLIIALCITLTALCWGAYGPLMHKGQMKMSGSRLRPFVGVGLAYFLIAVVVPLSLTGTGLRDPDGWHFVSGSIWSLLGGATGALGALGIIYAFNFGGKPVLVMPLVFGCTPVANTLFATLFDGTVNKITTSFYLSLLLLIVGAVTVLVFAPKTDITEHEEEREDLPDEKANSHSKGNSAENAIESESDDTESQ